MADLFIYGSMNIPYRPFRFITMLNPNKDVAEYNKILFWNPQKQCWTTQFLLISIPLAEKEFPKVKKLYGETVELSKSARRMEGSYTNYTFEIVTSRK